MVKTIVRALLSASSPRKGKVVNGNRNQPAANAQDCGRFDSSAPRLDRSGGLSRHSAVREVAAWLGDLCDSSVFFDFPFS